MIAYIQGKITHKNPAYIYVETEGIGYIVYISLHTFQKIEEKEEVKLFTHLQIKEDSHTLFGFFTEEEKNLFLKLLSVSGIGGNTARLMLSYKDPYEIKRAIANEDVKTITSIKGIGPKTAKRVILDLKEKIIKEGLEVSGSDIPTGNMIREEALSALTSLGFQRNVVEKAVDAALKSQPDLSQVEDLIKLVLKQVK